MRSLGIPKLSHTLAATCMLNGYKSVYETDLFSDIIARLEALSGKKYGSQESVTKAMRIIADHMRTATFMIGDEKGVTPSRRGGGRTP